MQNLYQNTCAVQIKYNLIFIKKVVCKNISLFNSIFLLLDNKYF